MAEHRPDLRMRLHLERAQRLAQGRARERRAVARRDGARIEIGGRWLVDFCGNDYLGLSQQFQVVDALQDAAARDGAGGVASALVCGHHVAHATLERAIAEWQQAPAALLFGSGYAANLAVLQALLGDDDLCVQDRLNHASLVDGARLAGCRLRRYPHNDAEGALRQLQSMPAAAAVLATDGVFSMDGDIAPLSELALAARTQRALLYVDDAHGAGVLGPDGQGSVAAAKLGLDEVPLRLVTFGKALGGYGAAVVGEADLVNHLAETARPHVYTTALPVPLAAATLAALKLARREAWRREKLAAHVAKFQELARGRGVPLLSSQTPIQPVPCGAEADAIALSKALEDAGFRVAAIRPPTVPEGGSRLRITLSAKHDDAHLVALVDALAAARERIAAAAATRAP